MVSNFILSQVSKLISFILVIVAFQIKRGNLFRILFVISTLFSEIHFILLGAISAASIVFINGLRWFVSIYTKNKIVIPVFIILILFVGYYNYESWVSLLTIFAGILGVFAVFNDNQIITRKILFIIAILWIIYNSIIFTPMGIIAEFFFLISNIVGYFRFFKDQKN